jgi:hypothetical protein
MIYEYSEVSCKGIEDVLRDDNLMVVIAPTPIIAAVVAGKFLKEIVNKIPLVVRRQMI